MLFGRRELLVGLAAGAGVSATMLFGMARRDQEGARVSVVDFRAAGDADDSAAFQRAIADGRRIHVPAGGGTAGDGAYVVAVPLTTSNLRSGTVIEGDGIGRTVIRHAGGDGYIFHCDSGSPDAARNISGVVIRDLTLEDDVARTGFSEHRHLVSVHGVTSLLVERVLFRGFRGDGLMIGSSVIPHSERHNRGVSVKTCQFDGVNKDNRNAISVLDGDGIAIAGCQFRNCSRRDMPGAIDFEPEASAYAVIRNISVTDCQFDNVGGGVAAISLFVPAAVPLPRNIAIAGNVFRDYSGVGNAVSLNVNRSLSAAASGMGVTISGNRGFNGRGIYGFVSAKGVRAFDNEWRDYDGGVLIGYVEPGNVARDVAIQDRFVRCARSGGGVIRIHNVSGAVLDGSIFTDCGSASAPSFAILFAQGASERVSLRGLRIAGLRGREARAVMGEPGHRLDPASNVERGNDFGGFPAVSIVRP